MKAQAAATGSLTASWCQVQDTLHACASNGLCRVQCVLYGACVSLQVMLHVTFKRHMQAIQLKLGEEAMQLLQQVSDLIYQ